MRRRNFAPWEHTFIRLANVEFTHRQIADALGRTTGTIQTYCSKAGLKKPRTHKEIEVGDVFGLLTVKAASTRRRPKNSSGQGASRYWLCRCVCGDEMEVRADQLSGGVAASCGSCGRMIDTKYVAAAYFHGIKNGCKKRGFEIRVSPQYVDTLFEAQNATCAISGLPIHMSKKGFYRLRTDGKITASLDRIDSNLGYVEGNLQWVHKAINVMKMGMPQEEFVAYCKAVVDHQERSCEVPA